MNYVFVKCVFPHPIDRETIILWHRQTRRWSISRFTIFIVLLHKYLNTITLRILYGQILKLAHKGQMPLSNWNTFICFLVGCSLYYCGELLAQSGSLYIRHVLASLTSTHISAHLTPFLVWAYCSDKIKSAVSVCIFIDYINQ